MRFKSLDNLSKAQKKIVTTSSIVVAAFLFFLIIVYLPSHKAVKNVKAELSYIESEIGEIGDTIGKDQPQYLGIELVQSKFAKLSSKFPQKEEDSLQVITNIARKLNIGIVALEPERKKVFTTNSGKELELDGKIIQVVYIDIRMKSFYRDLAKYIEALKEDLPAFMTVEDIKISKGISDTAKLDVRLKIGIYLSS